MKIVRLLNVRWRCGLFGSWPCDSRMYLCGECVWACVSCIWNLCFTLKFIDKILYTEYIYFSNDRRPFKNNFFLRFCNRIFRHMQFFTFVFFFFFCRLVEPEYFMAVELNVYFYAVNATENWKNLLNLNIWYVSLTPIFMCWSRLLKLKTKTACE